jgi:hypothetical protein
MSDIKEKRTSLERFIKEHTIGPGACGNRFFLLRSWDSNVFAKKNLKRCVPLDNSTEVIDEVPAYYYGTGILFPPARLVSNSKQEDESVEGSNISQREEESNGHSVEEDQEVEKASIEQENRHAGNQNYPTTSGLSFSIDDENDIPSCLAVLLNFRLYSLVKPKELTSNFAIWIDDYEEEFKSLVDNFFAEFFSIEERDRNFFIISKISDFSKDNSYRLDYKLFEFFQHEYLKDWKQQKIAYEGSVITKGGLYDITPLRLDEWITALENQMIACSISESEIKLLEKLTIIKKVKEIIETFKAAMLSRRPIWLSRYYDFPVSLPRHNGNKRQIGQLTVFKEDDIKLNLHYQYITKGGKIYVKLIMENASVPIEMQEDVPFQLNKKNEANQKSLFNPTLSVTEKTKGVICRYNPPNIREFDSDEDLNKILYRQYEDLGEGYNTSVVWGKNNMNLKFIKTEYLPTSDTPNIDTRPSKINNGKVEPRLSDPDVLRIKRLSTLDVRSNKEIQQDLEVFLLDYERWINDKRKELETLNLTDTQKSIMSSQLSKCELDLRRLQRNVRLLNDEDVMIAFRTMNTAMFMQLHHSIFIRNAEKNSSLPYIKEPSENTYSVLPDDTPDKRGALSWKAFQLAFILLNIDAFAKPPDDDQIFIKESHELRSKWYERNDLADLVWFPTGGGKTEAYLGIIAFAIAYRRFTKNEAGYGTTVIMRYTLRLLTLQQFQRATLLICAMEVIRSRHFDLKGRSLGDERITIGLYVGGNSLPNKWDEKDPSQRRIGMKQEIEKIFRSLELGEEPQTRLPHTECPWCGGKLWDTNDAESILVKKDNQGNPKSPLRLWCMHDGCAFNDPGMFENELPLILYDEAIYKTPPTLLFGTVDKFAQLAHKVSDKDHEDSRRIFKRDGSNILPPELIIQDELHLLLGPLGSAVGIFERAIDVLCTHEEKGASIRPKVITSTATTRNTDKQIFGLFDRRVSIFPKQGIDCDDSFFAYYDRYFENGGTNYRSNRRYIGVLPIGKTQVWMQLRVVAACLVHRSLYLSKCSNTIEIARNKGDLQGEILLAMDYYHTVLGYFNSLKEVGKTESQLHHYLPNEVKLIRQKASTWNVFHDILNHGDRIYYSELTGRLSGEDVKTNLSVIRTPWRLFNQPSIPPDYVIATNMISVGVDISRFNTMVITSMPRNIAEYIQASSRVARDREGLVITVHHPFRSRDLSHYQHFIEFHEKFYSYVEPISITPFATKALERYLALFVATFIRHEENELAIDANHINEDLTQELLITLTHLIEMLKERAKAMNMEDVLDEDEFNGTVVKLHELLRKRWLERKIKGDELSYREESSSSSLYFPRKGSPEHDNWNVKDSLREVDPECVIKTVQM